MLAKALTLALVMLFLATPALAQDDALLVQAIGTIQEQKSLAESRVARVKSDFDRDQFQYVLTEMSYGEAKAAFDALVRELVTALDAGGMSDAALREEVETAVTRSQALINLVEEFYGEDEEIREAAKSYTLIVGELVEAFIGAALRIWDRYQEATRAKREAIKNELENLYWKDFGEIS